MDCSGVIPIYRSVKSRGTRFIGVSRRFCDSTHVTEMLEGSWEVVGLILSRLLSLNIRVREGAWVCNLKRGKDLLDTFLGGKLEKPVLSVLPHPVHVPEIEFESVEELDSRTLDGRTIVGSRIVEAKSVWH
ncbi:hypothetical protein EVAR_51298_1 [Eumeta japonica]|uniref:Uncharacterized protein n=1 Tax=Eumeta variegata TaxID=151549 RepID=A0A4C1XV78_EUMVA|nr:hypothetical protein EVAR_51298_1 [Eumeta japonica]